MRYAGGLGPGPELALGWSAYFRTARLLSIDERALSALSEKHELNDSPRPEMAENVLETLHYALKFQRSLCKLARKYPMTQRLRGSQCKHGHGVMRIGTLARLEAA